MSEEYFKLTQITKEEFEADEKNSHATDSDVDSLEQLILDHKDQLDQHPKKVFKGLNLSPKENEDYVIPFDTREFLYFK